MHCSEFVGIQKVGQKAKKVNVDNEPPDISWGREVSPPKSGSRIQKLSFSVVDKNITLKLGRDSYLIPL